MARKLLVPVAGFLLAASGMTEYAAASAIADGLASDKATSAHTAAATNKTTNKKSPPLTPNQRAAHALNRLTFGPHPQDLADVTAMGVDRWIELQLHPEKINDSELQSLLQQLPAMQLSEARLIERFPPNPMVRRMELTGAKLPADPIERAIYANAEANLQAQQQKKAAEQASNAAPSAKPAALPATKTAAPESEGRDVSKAQADRILQLPGAQQRFQALLALPAGEPRHVLQAMRPLDRQRLVEGMTPEQKEGVVALADINRVVAGEAMEQKLLYDIYSRRQLQEVMTDFWLNHFNVYLRKSGLAPWEVAIYERDTIRPHAFGKFEELLDAVATSPAMMVYLDNAESIGPDSPAAQNAGRRNNNGGAAKPAAARGLNENYARELMELHTLGVNGGYTQRDVTEVAKVFTGWTIAAPRDGGGFTYNERRHEPGSKIVLGKTIRENGQQEGFEVLHLLASSPATAHFISRELAVRFVSDDPPQSLINRMAKKYLSTHGDIRQVLRVMFQSQEFWSPKTYDAKVKTPLEFVVSSVRATNADATHPQSLIASLNQMGMPLYGMQPPTGYSTTADKWVSSEQLITRMNFALALTSNKLPGIVCALPGGIANGSTEQNEAQLERVLLNGEVSPETRATVVKEMKDLGTQPPIAPQAPVRQSALAPDPMAIRLPKKNGSARPVEFTRDITTAGGGDQTTVAAGLLLGSPDFQRH